MLDLLAGWPNACRRCETPARLKAAFRAPHIGSGLQTGNLSWITREEGSARVARGFLMSACATQHNNFLYSSFPVRLDTPSAVEQDSAGKEIRGVWAHPDPFYDGINQLRRQHQGARVYAGLEGDVMGSFLSRAALQFGFLTVHWMRANHHHSNNGWG